MSWSIKQSRARRPTITARDQLNRWDTTVNARRRLNCYSIGSLLISGVFVLLDLIFDGFGPLRSNTEAAGPWCWVKDAGEKDNDDAQFAFISFYGIAFASIAVIVFFYMLVLLKICRRMRETRWLQMLAFFSHQRPHAAALEDYLSGGDLSDSGDYSASRYYPQTACHFEYRHAAHVA